MHVSRLVAQSGGDTHSRGGEGRGRGRWARMWASGESCTKRPKAEGAGDGDELCPHLLLLLLPPQRRRKRGTVLKKNTVTTATAALAADAVAAAQMPYWRLPAYGQCGCAHQLRRPNNSVLFGSTSSFAYDGPKCGDLFVLAIIIIMRKRREANQHHAPLHVWYGLCCARRWPARTFLTSL